MKPNRKKRLFEKLELNHAGLVEDGMGIHKMCESDNVCQREKRQTKRLRKYLIGIRKTVYISSESSIWIWTINLWRENCICRAGRAHKSMVESFFHSSLDRIEKKQTWKKLHGELNSWSFWGQTHAWLIKNRHFFHPKMMTILIES